MNSTTFRKGHVPWNKGLTKSDPRVRRNIDNSTETKIKKYGTAFPSNNMSEDHKRKIGESNKGKKSPYKGVPRSEEVKRKISASKIGHKVSEDTKQKISKTKTGKKLSKDKLEIKLTKEYLTKKKNNSFNSSSVESQLYKYLLKENVNKTIYRQYKDERYPYYCDFYIKEDDLFIELNAHWTHGGKAYDPEDPYCQKQLLEWQEKAKTSQFYQVAINTWTIRDVEKLQCAIKNNLNYKVIY